MGSLATICLLRGSIKLFAYKHFRHFGARAASAIAIVTSKIWPNLQNLKGKEPFSDRLSGLATRNLFSWTLFTEGVRTEEKPLWKHEWLETLIKRDLNANLSESSSSGMEGEDKYQDIEYIKSWQEDVSIHAVSDCECLSNN